MNNNYRKRQVCLLLCALGFWLLASPLTFGYKTAQLIHSDHASGFLLIIAGLVALFHSQRIVFTSGIIVGLWLELAPLIFWASEPVEFLNDTLVGLLALTMVFLLPGMQGQAAKEGADCPPGWSFNPSGWTPRICTIFLALFCWFAARYLSTYQLGYISTVWDPFFHGETVKVLTSNVAKMFPVSDAGLGALGYSLEAFLGWQGNQQRWRTMPWLVILFGILVVPAGLVSILLIVLQPIVVHAWCGLCLLIAVAMLVMIVLSVSEMVACLQFLHYVRIENRMSLRKIFWFGSDPTKIGKTIPSKEWGFSFSWNLLLTSLLGAWLMYSPSYFEMNGFFLSDSNYVAGPLIITISLISMAEVIRPLRFMNMLLGAILLLSQWTFGGEGSLLGWNNALCGLLVILLSYRRGPITGSYGSWTRFIV